MSAAPAPPKDHVDVDAVANSAALRKAPAVRALLLYLWEHRAEAVNEFKIATECLGKKDDFDPKLDATVRVHVSRLRQKLKEYYDSVPAAPPYRIAVPQGSYQIEVVADAMPPAAAEVPLAGPPAPSRAALYALAACAILLACLSAWLYRQNRELASLQAARQMPRFWADFFAGGKPTTVVLPTPVFFEWRDNLLKVRDTRVNDFEDLAASPLLKPLAERYGPPKLMQNYTVVSDTFAAVKLAQYLQARGVTISFSGTADFSLDQFGGRNVVLIGLVSTNFHIRRLMERSNFYSNPEEASTVINRAPRPGEQARYRMVEQSGSRRSSTGIVGLFAGTEPDTRILMLAGQATASLVSFLTNDGSLAQLDQVWRSAGTPPLYEMLVQSEIEGNAVLRAWPRALRAGGK